MSDEQRRAIGLTTTLDGTTRELVDLAAAVEVDPADGTLVTNEDLELAKLARRKSQHVIGPSYTPENTLTWCSL